jgi:hypothetical protein
MSDDFDGLVEQSRSAVNKLGHQALWKQAMALEAWYFVGQGHGDDAEPMVASLEGRPTLLAFTEEERALDFAKRRAQTKGGNIAPILSMETADAVDYCKQLRDLGVDSVLFNSGAYSFESGLTGIVDMFGRYGPSRG